MFSACLFENENNYNSIFTCDITKLLFLPFFKYLPVWHITREIKPTNALFLTILLIEDTDGRVSWVQMPSFSRRSLISQANMVGVSALYRWMASTTWGVATFGFDPPITPGRMLPVSLYLQMARDFCAYLHYSILEFMPWHLGQTKNLS